MGRLRKSTLVMMLPISSAEGVFSSLVDIDANRF